MNALSIVILAAGKGTRMYSDLPKVLHKLAGKPLIQHVIDACQPLSADHIHVIYGFGGELLKSALIQQPLSFIKQAELLGTGHAVQQVIPFIQDDEDVLILYGDGPLITTKTLRKLINKKQQTNAVVLLTAHVDNPTGYGRILRCDDKVCRIVEQKDATAEQLVINEINSGILLVEGKKLKHWLNQLTTKNAQGEYYLTDIIELAYRDGVIIETVNPYDNNEIEGINDRVQLAAAERYYQKRQANKLLCAGLTLCDPERFDLRGTLTFGKDVFIDTNVIFEGDVVLGDRVQIGTGSVLKNCEIGSDTIISPYSVVENATLETGCTIGPFVRLRPGTKLKTNVHVGNFVEVKNAILGENTKAGHLSYLGDAEIGKKVNIGAGTITCNYDGANKHKTVIGNDVFVGSDTQIVAPVTIGDGVTIGAGTTVTDDIFENELVISRVKQKHITGWQRPKKKN